MRFTLIDNLQNDKTMSLILKGFLLFILLYIVVDVLVMHSSFGISIDTLNTTLFGNEEEFVDPLTESALLEFWHIQIFFIMMILFTLNTIYIRVAKRSRMIMTSILMLSSITSLVTLPLAFYISKHFVVVYLLTFFIWHIVGVLMTLYAFWKLRA